MRAVSLSQEPVLSVLKNELVCGYKDISSESYAGFSGSHKIGENAINTTNGAGPHNVQSFLMASDGTVLHCLPGYWHPQDLVREVEFAGRLHDVWTNKKLSSTQKRQHFKSMQLSHVNEHPWQMKRRSRMQSFDMEHEAKHRLRNSDTITNAGVAQAILSKDRMTKIKAMRGFKTTDQIMHERMASRPFVSYSHFDVAKFADYGRPLYDKSENFRNENGQFLDNGRVVEKPPAKVRQQELLGKIPDEIQRRRERMRRLQGLPGRQISSRSNNNSKYWGGRRNNSGSLWGAR